MDRHELEQISNQIGELVGHGSPSCLQQARSILFENYNQIISFALQSSDPPPKPNHTIADNYPAGGLTSTEPCMFCEDYNDLEAKYDALQKSHTKLVDACRAGGIELEFYHSRMKRLLDTLAMIEQALEEAEKIT